ncbi:hypothetical protein C9974_12710 [Marinobacter sp. B9-2]|nr:hypothetical protein C9974_12710 [Marinobacter sp. B9-2]
MKIIYIDMDDTLCDFQGAFAKALNERPEMPYPQSQYRFFANLEPIAGAIETFKDMIRSDVYDPYILSAPSLKNAFSYSEKREWVETHIGYDFCDRLIICAHKGLLRGDILVDDKSSGMGQEDFEGQIIQFGSPRFPDWEFVRDALSL